MGAGVTGRAARGNLNGPQSRTLRRAGWALGLVAVVVLLALGARPAPVEGTSQDRLHRIAEQLKCLKCSGESVASSQSGFAQTMRAAIEEQMRAGKSDDEIFTAMAQAYGERVLLNPRGTGIGALVWVLPVVVAFGGVAGMGVAFMSARSRRDSSASLRVDAAGAAKVEAALRAGVSGVSADAGGAASAGGAADDPGST